MWGLAFWALAIGCTAATGAQAGDKPLYGAAPTWVIPAPPIDLAKLGENPPVVLIMDNQQRVDGDKVAVYVETATRANNAEVLGHLGTIAIPWMPDKGDLTVHRAEIMRGDERIDLLAGDGEKFTTLQREAQLEQRMVSGMLTATMHAQGLRIGDVLRVAFTITQQDAALKGKVQTIAPVLSDPFRASFGRSRLSWPSGVTVNWKGYAAGLKPTVSDVGGIRAIEVALPLAKQPEVPSDAPPRFTRLPIIEATSFVDWSDVSRTMAPLYATEGTIAPGSALAAEIAKIKAAESDPLRRTAAALRLVQDEVRYLLMGMNGGNYVPQSPAKTWEVRYGDCKAKTLILLAMLREMGIEAEAVLASTQLGDGVPERLPMPGAFDHVLVRATVDGQTLWLDGTSSGARFEDIADTPWLRHVLPLRPAGATLMPVVMKPPVRAETTTTIDLDHSVGVDLPSLFRMETRLRGAEAAMVKAVSAQVTAEQLRELVGRLVAGYLGKVQLSEAATNFDAASGIATITAAGVANNRWRMTDRRYRMAFDRAVEGLSFEPDRSRVIWREIPVSTGAPESEEFKLRVKLPAGVSGFALQGDDGFAGTLAGRTISRRASLTGDTALLDERVDSLGGEIEPAAIAAERAKVALAKTRLLKLVAPADAPRRWDDGANALRSGRYKALDAAFSKAIANDPEEFSGYESRANFRLGVYDWKGGLEDLTRMIAIQSDAATHLRRASVHHLLKQDAKARADVAEARKLDPGSDSALFRDAGYKADDGDFKGALALIDERIALGGEDRFDAINVKADIQAQGGDPAAGIATLDAAIAEKPGDPTLLNARCWLKGTYNLQLESALKDCTKAIELADTPAAELDSRAMVYFRMNRMDDALADLNAALEMSPGMGAARYLRGVIAKRTGRAGGGDKDLAIARLMSPRIDEDYAKYGIKP